VLARVAWAGCALAVLATVLDTTFTAAHRSLWSESTWAEHGWPLAPMANLGCALMGALIVSRHPRHPLGWLLCVASLLAVTLAAEAYGVWVIDGDGPGPDSWGHVALWAGPLLGWPAFSALVLVFLLAPDGRLLSPRWRWAVGITLAGLLLHTLGTLSTPPSDFVYGQRDSTRAITAPLLTAGWMLVAVGLVASAVSLLLRLRRSRDDVRRQLLWIAAAAAMLAIGVVVILAVPRITGVEGTWLAGLPLRVAQVMVPVCVAVAVLRHRLLEIDLIISRALTVALATALVTVGYVLVVVTVGLIVDGTSGFWPSLLATAVVAIAFQPLRSRVIRIADRLAFGTAAAPYEALEDFSRRLEDSPDPTDLLPSVAEAAGRAVRARRASVVLHVDAGLDLTASWPGDQPDDLSSGRLEVPVVHLAERLGTITVEMPAGQPLRAREHRLLADLADQAGLAFRNARLTAELAGQVGQLGQRNQELESSRVRIISASDAERRRLERDIARQVVPHLQPLADRLHELATSSKATAAPDIAALDPLVASLNSAVEALREITRGVFPAQLARSGLPTAIGSLLARTATSHQLVVEDSVTTSRFDAQVEAAAYFCVAEAICFLGEPVVVSLSTAGDRLRVTVHGDEDGALPLTYIRDRVEAVGGVVSMDVVDGRVVLDAWLQLTRHGEQRLSRPREAGPVRTPTW
jgi:signal transduction histidine kinase